MKLLILVAGMCVVSGSTCLLLSLDIIFWILPFLRLICYNQVVVVFFTKPRIVVETKTELLIFCLIFLKFFLIKHFHKPSAPIPKLLTCEVKLKYNKRFWPRLVYCDKVADIRYALIVKLGIDELKLKLLTFTTSVKNAELHLHACDM